MIHSITFSNFHSVGDSITANFTVNELAPKTFGYIDDALGSRVSVVSSIIGPNASGKTNVLRALSFVRWLIVDAYSDDPERIMPVEGFSGSSKPSTFKVTFSVQQHVFIYEVKLNKERILTEVLKERSLTKKRVTEKSLFSRKWSNKERGYEVNDNVFSLPVAGIRANSSALSVAHRGLNDLATLIVKYWKANVATNVIKTGYVGDHNEIGRSMPHHAISHYYKNKELMESVMDVLAKYDIGFDKFNEYESVSRKEYTITHKFGPTEFDLPLEYESSGTKQLIVVLRFILSALSTSGGVAIIDELDAYLHPDIIEDLVGMFLSPEININKSQLIFTSHSHRMLTDFDKYQIFITQKDKQGQSGLWRLDELGGIRPDENYYAKYIAGAYGGVPNIEA